MNNKGADQTVGMRRLVCAFVVRKPPKTGFLAARPICLYNILHVGVDAICIRNLVVCNTSKGSLYSNNPPVVDEFMLSIDSLSAGRLR